MALNGARGVTVEWRREPVGGSCRVCAGGGAETLGYPSDRVRGGPPVDVTVENHASETDADLMAPVSCVVGIILECLVL